MPDSVSAQIEFADGSCGQLLYSAEGDSSYPKERCTVYGAGIVADITNFQSLEVHQGRKKVNFKYDQRGMRNRWPHGWHSTGQITRCRMRRRARACS